MRFVGSLLGEMKFRVCDTTYLHRAPLGSGHITPITDLIPTVLTPFIRDDHETGIEEIDADYDRPVAGPWLVAAYDAIFRSVDDVDIELEIDPDEYPVF
jgi:hypothetical protein